jgi:hypothetical protein
MILVMLSRCIVASSAVDRETAWRANAVIEQATEQQTTARILTLHAAHGGAPRRPAAAVHR